MSDSLQATFANAKNLFQKGNYEAARKDFIGLLNANHDPLSCHYYLGLANLNLKNYDEAFKEFSVCLKSNPYDANYLYYLGLVSDLQQNEDLALHYYYKTLQVNPDHTNAKKAIERLSTAHRNDIPQQSFHQNSNHQNTNNHTAQHRAANNHTYSNPNANGANQNNGSTDPIQLYDELLMSKDPDSMIAVQMIQATALKRRPRLRAYIGVFFLRVFILPLFLTIILGVLPVGRITFAEKYNLEVMLNWYIFFAVVCLIYHIIWVKTIMIIIDKGFIDVTKGVFSRNKRIFLCHKADHFQIHQNFFNLITGDCTLLFDLDSGHKGKLKLTGLGRVKDINNLATNLQNLRYQLRNTPAIRSGIYG